METRSRMHYHHHTPNPHLQHISYVKWDIGQMLTPPKSKSPWEAMTAGSTGGWASSLAPGGKLGFMGPVGTALAGLIPGVGPFLSAGMGAAGTMGKGTGFQGLDKGWGNILPTIGGGLAGWGAGGLAKGITGGLSSVLGPMSKASQTGYLANALKSAPGITPYTGYGVGTGTAMGSALASGGGAAGLLGTGFGQGISQYLQTTTSPFQKIGMNISKMLGGGTTPTTGTTGTSIGTNLSNAGTPAATTSAANAMLQAGGATQTASKGWGSNMLDFFLNPKNLSGLALIGASALPRNATYTSPDIMGEATARLLGSGGISEVGLKGREELMKIMNRSPEYMGQAMDPWLTAASQKADEAYNDAEKALTKKFKGYGADESREFMQEMTNLRQDRAREKSALQYEAQQREYTRVQNQLYDAVKTALTVDDATMKDLLGLTGLAIEEAGLKYGAEAADVKSLREALGLGGAAMLNLENTNYQGYSVPYRNYSVQSMFGI